MNANGVVTAVNIGTAIITAKTNDGNFTATCNVNVTNSVAGTTNTYEAEDFTAQNGCTFKTQFAGFSGTGYMKYSANGDWIEWNNVAGTGGTSNLKFTYAAANTNPSRPCEVLVNDVYAGTLTFTNTSSWTTYSTETVSALLVAGNNTVRVKAISAEGGPDLDKMDVTTYTTGIVDTFSSNYVKVYQNKISRTISIELAQDFNVEVEIYDINARSVFNKKYDGTANIHINTLNLNMRDGIYFVSIKNENSSVVKKLMFKL